MSDLRTVEGEGADDASIEATWDSLAAARTDTGDGPPAKASDDLKEGEEAPKVEAPATADSPASDPWKDAPPELREAHERDIAAERTRAETAETVARRHSGRLSKAETELAALRTKLAPQREETGAQEEASTREERREKLREEYPEVAGPILDELSSLTEAVTELKGAASHQAESQTQALLDEQVSILAKAHPAWETEIKDNPKFVEWAVGQPDYIKGVIRENAMNIVSGDDVADVIERYRRDTTPTQEDPEAARRKEQLEAGRDTRVRSPAPGVAADGSDEAVWSELAAKRERAAGGNKR